MQKVWTANIKDEKEVERIKGEFDGSRFLLDRLIFLLDKKQEASNEKIRKEDIYDKPNFEWYVADQLGYQRCITDIINLIKE